MDEHILTKNVTYKTISARTRKSCKKRDFLPQNGQQNTSRHTTLKQRRFNVNSTSRHWINVESTLFQRYVSAGTPTASLLQNSCKSLLCLRYHLTLYSFASLQRVTLRKHVYLHELKILQPPPPPPKKKKGKFSERKSLIFFTFLLKTQIVCVSLEPPRPCGSKQYLGSSMFLQQNKKKIMYTPVNNVYPYTPVSHSESKLHRRYIMIF